ncbi:hypothetical protein FF38_05774 [Lucilia cuprina]|uniref:Uncharacterized protein n=1 Tax=Lucilia cuprina TaxID=7375 RepID=A0A0L0C8K0_LUCCU|nr:hypothetical protein FF38_05774 [Lucilia cuprina]
MILKPLLHNKEVVLNILYKVLINYIPQKKVKFKVFLVGVLLIVSSVFCLLLTALKPTEVVVLTKGFVATTNCFLAKISLIFNDCEVSSSGSSSSCSQLAEKDCDRFLRLAERLFPLGVSDCEELQLEECVESCETCMSSISTVFSIISSVSSACEKISGSLFNRFVLIESLLFLSGFVLFEDLEQLTFKRLTLILKLSAENSAILSCCKPFKGEEDLSGVKR